MKKCLKILLIKLLIFGSPITSWSQNHFEFKEEELGQTAYIKNNQLFFSAITADSEIIPRVHLESDQYSCEVDTLKSKEKKGKEVYYLFLLKPNCAGVNIQKIFVYLSPDRKNSYSKDVLIFVPE